MLVAKGTEMHTSTAPSTLFTLEQPVASSLRWSRVVLLPFFLTRLLLLAVGYATWIFIAPHLAGEAYLPTGRTLASLGWQMWRWFDSYWYLTIAEKGYPPGHILHIQTDWAFYPLYPVSIYLLGRLFGGTDTADGLAGILISNGCALTALTYLYLLVNRNMSERVARRTVLFFVLAPMAFYLSAAYTESLWLALALSCLYYSGRRQWVLAGTLGALASLTRAQGVGLLVPLLWELWQVASSRERPLLFERGWHRFLAWWLSRIWGLLLALRRRETWLALTGVCLIPLGILAFDVYAWMETGDFSASTDTEKWGWYRQFAMPWTTVWNAVTHPVWPFAVTDWSAWPLSLAAIVLVLVLLIPIAWKLPSIYTIYTLTMLLVPLATGTVNSVDRYYLVIFPVQILLALLSLKRGWGWLAWCIAGICLVLQCAGMASFVLGFPFIA
jgi:hypothetical protein